MWKCFFSVTYTSFVVTILYFQKKATLALLPQEQAKARQEATHQEKLREEERTISEALLESKTDVCCATKSVLS